MRSAVYPSRILINVEMFVIKIEFMLSELFGMFFNNFVSLIFVYRSGLYKRKYACFEDDSVLQKHIFSHDLPHYMHDVVFDAHIYARMSG